MIWTSFALDVTRKGNVLPEVWSEAAVSCIRVHLNNPVYLRDRALVSDGKRRNAMYATSGPGPEVTQ